MQKISDYTGSHGALCCRDYAGNIRESKWKKKTKIFRQMGIGRGTNGSDGVLQKYGKGNRRVERRIQGTGNRKAVRVKHESILQERRKKKNGNGVTASNYKRYEQIK